MHNASSDAEVCTSAQLKSEALIVRLQAMRQMLEDTGADGYNGDTMVICAAGSLYCRYDAISLGVL
jgi:hypothetical protein